MHMEGTDPAIAAARSITPWLAETVPAVRRCVRARPPARSARVVEVGAPCCVPQRVRYNNVRWIRPAEIVELRFSTGCHVTLVAFES